MHRLLARKPLSGSAVGDAAAKLKAVVDWTSKGAMVKVAAMGQSGLANSRVGVNWPFDFEIGKCGVYHDQNMRRVSRVWA